MEGTTALGTTPQMLFSHKTGKRLDRVRNYLGDPGGEPKPRIRGGQTTKDVLKDLGLVQQGSWPRNQPAYEMIRDVFPGFEWERGEDGEGRVWVRFTGYPTVGGSEPSLADLSVESLRTAVMSEAPPHIQVDLFTPSLQRRLGPLLTMRRPDEPTCVDDRGAQLGRVLADLHIAYPPLQIMEAVRAWWERALKGEPTTVVTAVCPDYATCATGDPTRPQAYTFDGLGEGIGLVARRALYALPKLWECFKANGAGHINFVVPVADNEADIAGNCERVDLTREQFLVKLRKSQEAFLAACPLGMPVTAPLLMSENRQMWDDLLACARQAVKNRRYGPLQLTEEDLTIIARARQPLYERWHGGAVDARTLLDAQAPEYMAVGDLVRSSFPNVLIFGTDAIPMAPFVQGTSTTIQPVLYLRGTEY